MLRRRWLPGVISALLVSHLPAPVRLAQTAPIHGADVMGERNKAGPDGLVQAPIPRVEAPSGTSPGEGKPDQSADSKIRPVPATGKKLSAGEDPGTPLSTAKPIPTQK